MLWFCIVWRLEVCARSCDQSGVCSAQVVKGVLAKHKQALGNCMRENNSNIQQVQVGVCYYAASECTSLSIQENRIHFNMHTVQRQTATSCTVPRPGLVQLHSLQGLQHNAFVVKWSRMDLPQQNNKLNQLLRRRRLRHTMSSNSSSSCPA